jgi:hypothetical protein
VPPGELHGLARGPRQEIEEDAEARWIERELRGELPEEGPELFCEREYARREEVGEGPLDIEELLWLSIRFDGSAGQCGRAAA